MKKIWKIVLLGLLLWGGAYAVEPVVITGTLQTNMHTPTVILTGTLQTWPEVISGLVIAVPCAPSVVDNGIVSPKTCQIACNAGYQLKDQTCQKNAISTWGWGGWWWWGWWGGWENSQSSVKEVVAPQAQTLPQKDLIQTPMSWSQIETVSLKKTLSSLLSSYQESHVQDSDKTTALHAVLESVKMSQETEELKDAYTYAYLRGITTQPSIEKAELNRGLTRAEMAKMMSVFATKVLGKKVVKTDTVQYADVKMDGDLPGFIQLAYQLQIMGIDAKGNAIENFNPNAEVSRAEFATVLSRVLYGDKYNQEGADFASKHLNALKDASVLKDTNPQMKELRGWVMLMLQRAEGVK